MPWVAVEIAMEIAVDLAVEIAVEIVMASAMGVHGVPLIAAAFRASPWNVRGSPWSVRGSPWSVHGCPWNAVEKDVERRGGPWALPRCSAKKTNNVHTKYHIYSECPIALFGRKSPFKTMGR